MKPLILVYYYYDESYNVLDTMEVFSYVDGVLSQPKIKPILLKIYVVVRVKIIPTKSI